jgi:hypothetical protein
MRALDPLSPLPYKFNNLQLYCMVIYHSSVSHVNHTYQVSQILVYSLVYSEEAKYGINIKARRQNRLRSPSQQDNPDFVLFFHLDFIRVCTGSLAGTRSKTFPLKILSPCDPS